MMHICCIQILCHFIEEICSSKDFAVCVSVRMRWPGERALEQDLRGIARGDNYSDLFTQSIILSNNGKTPLGVSMRFHLAGETHPHVRGTISRVGVISQLKGRNLHS